MGYGFAIRKVLAVQDSEFRTEGILGRLEPTILISHVTSGNNFCGTSRKCGSQIDCKG
jgi:hypothetical protein